MEIGYPKFSAERAERIVPEAAATTVRKVA
jgi:hypothetical protein